MKDNQENEKDPASETSTDGGDVEDWDLEEENVEARIASEFIFNVSDSDIDVEIIDIMGELLHEEDFGGEDLIIERIEEAKLNDED